MADGLFDHPLDPMMQPLAARMRPRTFADFVGQEHITGSDAPFRKLAEAGKLGSIILWGPPGVGKTTLAEIVAKASGAHLRSLSATSAGVADLRKVIDEARSALKVGKRVILFIDEIHRFNKAQQDAILPVVEDGTVALIGATTENPSFEVNSALLSRSRVYVLNALSDADIATVLRRAMESDLGIRVSMTEEAFQGIVLHANGDARSALNLVELVAEASAGTVADLDLVKEVAQTRTLLYDKTGEMHYDLMSALHKCVRDSDVDASLYWLARMIDGGEDPLYIARRLVRMASEDIGLADPHALTLAVSAQQAVHFVGLPEGALALAQATAYLAAAPKSNALYLAFGAAQEDVAKTRSDPVPIHLRNAPTRLMKQLGYGEGYKYAHDFEGARVDQEHLPENLRGRRYFNPTDRGWEGKRLKRPDSN